MSIQTAPYSIPVSALAEGIPAGLWRRESPPAPPQPIFQPAPSQPAGTVLFSVGQTIEQVEREMIAKTMHATHGNRTRAARMLGISVRTLYTKLRTMAVAARINGAPAPAHAPMESSLA
jgi:DNA-binding NtrC family response regulator